MQAGGVGGPSFPAHPGPPCSPQNDATLTNRALDSLACRRRVLLSGTPLQNRLDEFYGGQRCAALCCAVLLCCCAMPRCAVLLCHAAL